MKTAIILLADGFEECEALIVSDLLRRGGVDVIKASVNGKYEVTSSGDTVVLADILAEAVDFDEADLLFLPGGGDGTENLRKNNIVREQCVRFAEEKMLAAICAAPSILAELGLLEGKEATCHPSYEDQMRGAILTHEGVAVGDNIITGQALGSAFNMALELLIQLADETTAEQVAEAICYL